MRVNVIEKHVSDREKKQFTTYLDKKLPRLKKLTTHFAEDAVLLTATVERFEKHDAYTISLRLEIPSGTLMAEETAHSITKGMDDAIDRLIAQLKSHMEKLRGR